jgi:hypothetical protein
VVDLQDGIELMGHHCSLAALQKDPDQPSVEA